MSRKNRRLALLAFLCALVSLGNILALILITSKNDQDAILEQRQKPSLPQSLLQQYGVDDGLDIKWLQNAKDQTDIAQALEEKVQMLEIIVVQAAGKFFTRGQRLSLSHIFDSLKPTHTGIKIKLDSSIETVIDAKRLIEDIRGGNFNSPVIISLPVLSRTFNWTLFLFEDMVKDDIMINFDLTEECCETGIRRGTVEYVDFLYNQVKSNSLIEVDVGHILSSWKSIRWLLSKNEQLMLILSANSQINNGTVYDMLTVRNDVDKNKVLYNLNETLYTEFRQLATTGGSPLHYFNIKPRDAGKVIWGHSTNTWQILRKAIRGDVMMIEGDIMLLDQNTPNQTNIPIMAHDVGGCNNLTFQQWIDEIIKVDKGMKLDFKSLDAVGPALEIASERRDKIKGPIWLNADILKGPNARETRILAHDFLEAIEEFPEATLSLGWTTVAKGTDYHLKYTMAMVKEMHNICKKRKQPITFPLRAEQLVDSWNEFDWLLEQSRRYTLTVWTSPTDNVTKSDMDFIKQQAETSRVYFDLPEKWRPSY